MRIAYALVATCWLWLTFVGAVRAEGPALVWSAPSGCPDRTSVQQAIARGADPQAESAVRAVRAEVRATEDGYSMELTLETAEGSHQKRLSARLCSTFVELLTLELSFASLPGAPLREREAPAAPKSIWGARVSGLVGTGPLPEPAAGVALALSLSRSALRLEVSGSYLVPRLLRYAEARAVAARFDAIGGELRGCYVLGLRKVALPFCAGVELGALHGRGLGADRNFSTFRLWADVFIAPALHFPIAGKVSGWAEVAGALLVRRPRFGVRNLPVLFQPDRLGVRGALGIVVRFN